MPGRRSAASGLSTPPCGSLKAKIAGEPLWRLLGASDRFSRRLRVGSRHRLDDEQLAVFYRTMAQRGFSSEPVKGGRDATADIRRLGLASPRPPVNAHAPPSCSTRTVVEPEAGGQACLAWSKKCTI